jgi:hypothetical protein
MPCRKSQGFCEGNLSTHKKISRKRREEGKGGIRENILSQNEKIKYLIHLLHSAFPLFHKELRRPAGRIDLRKFPR